MNLLSAYAHRFREEREERERGSVYVRGVCVRGWGCRGRRRGDGEAEFPPLTGAGSV